MTRPQSQGSPSLRASAFGALVVVGSGLFAVLLLREPAPGPRSPLPADHPPPGSIAPSPQPALEPDAPAGPSSRRALADLSPEERRRALDELEACFRADPAAYSEIIVAAALELARHRPAEAFFFLARFHGFASITQAKRRIVFDWSASGLDEIATALRQQVNEQRGGSEFLMPFLVSIHQNERAADFAGFLGWIDTFSAPAERDIRVSAANSLLRLCRPEQRPEIARLYVKQPDMHPWAAALLVQHADASPAEALELVGRDDFADLPAPLVGDVLRAVAETSPETASRVVQTAYLQELAADRAQATGAELPAVRDELLSSLLNGLLISNPASAWELAGHLSDKTTRERMLDRIQDLINARG